MEPYENWPLIILEESLQIQLRRNPQDVEEYGFNHVGTQDYLFLPRGTLKEIARSTGVGHGRRIIESLVRNSHLIREDIIHSKKGITTDTLIALITKAYLFETERIFEDLKDLRQR